MNNQKNKIIIALDGPDGLGKTTQALLLRDKLEEKGFSVCYRKQPHKNRKKIFNPNTKASKVAQLTLEEYKTIHNQFISSDHDIMVMDRCAFTSIPSYNYQKMTFDEVLDTEKYMSYMATKYKVPDIYFIFTGKAHRSPDDTIFEQTQYRQYAIESYNGMLAHKEKLKDVDIYRNSVFYEVDANQEIGEVTEYMVEIITNCIETESL